MGFDPRVSEDEKQIYKKANLGIHLVQERKIHYTTCKCHIGIASAPETNIKMYPILRVTYCNK